MKHIIEIVLMIFLIVYLTVGILILIIPAYFIQIAAHIVSVFAIFVYSVMQLLMEGYSGLGKRLNALAFKRN